MSTSTESFNTSASDLLGLQCSSCLTSYNNDEEYKNHYKSEFHKYNILRKMVQLAVVSKVQFEKHLLETKKVVKPIIDVKPTYHCEICSKKFKTDAMLKNHNTSKRHLERLSEIRT